MEFIKENKKTLIICSLILLFGLLIAYLVDKDVFNNNEDSNNREYLKNYQVNEIIPINMNEEQIARKYLAEYVKLIIVDPELAYDLLEPEYREERFNNINKFKDYFANLLSDRFIDGNVKELNVTSKGSYKQFYIVDSNDNTFIFNEYSIMQYKVMFDIITI